MWRREKEREEVGRWRWRGRRRRGKKRIRIRGRQVGKSTMLFEYSCVTEGAQLTLCSATEK